MNASEELVVDFEAIRANTLGDEAFERRLLQAFLDDNEERIERAREALAAGDREALEREAHTLKGAASTLGALPLAAASKALERAAQAGHLTEAAALFPDVQRELGRVSDRLREHLAR